MKQVLRPIFLVGAIAALAMLVSTSSALATSSLYCKTNNTPCPATDHVVSGTMISMALTGGTKVSLKAGIFSVQCGKSTAEVKTITTGGSVGGALETVLAFFTDLTLSECGSCRARVEKPITADQTQVSVSTHWNSGSMNGKLTIGTGIEVEVECLGISCRYGSSISNGATLIGGSPALVDINEVPVNRIGGSGLCGTPGIWNAEYTVSSPAAIWVSER